MGFQTGYTNLQIRSFAGSPISLEGPVFSPSVGVLPVAPVTYNSVEQALAQQPVQVDKNAPIGTAMASSSAPSYTSQPMMTEGATYVTPGAPVITGQMNTSVLFALIAIVVLLLFLR